MYTDSGITLSISISTFIGVPEEEEKEQEIGDLFEKTMNENLPNLVKETDMQVQEAESPKQDDTNRSTPRHIIIKMPRVKDRENLKSSKRKAESYIRLLHTRVP